LTSGEYFLENIMQSVVDNSSPPVIKFFLVLKLIAPAANTEEN
jgi:hypothetical protein